MRMRTGTIFFALVAVLAVGSGHGRILRLPSVSSLYSTRMVAGNRALKRSTSGLRKGDIAPPVPVFMMMPLDTVADNGTLSEEAIRCLPGVRDIGADGIMIDVWWGLCEKSPGEYNFEPYLQIMARCKELGLKVQTVMSFHGCGGNIGDSVNIPIPSWVLEKEEHVPELFYRDKRGDPSREYVSLSCDNIAVFPRAHGQEGQRTALDLYEDYMLAFSQWMQPYIEDGTLVEIQVGCGPCGELRYPSYPLSPREHSPDGWTWPGIGELQCYDVGMMRDMRDILQREETPDGLGQYNDAPDDTPFWRAPSSVSLASLTSCLGGSTKEQERWDSQKGSAFLAWYSGALIQHGRSVLTRARKVFGPEMRLAAKVSGIHWLRGHPSRAAEATAGYVGDYLNAVCEMLAETNTVLDFTCFEMRDVLQAGFAHSRPQGLVQSAAQATVNKGVGFAGENALACWEDEGAVETMEEQCELALAAGAEMEGLTALRVNDWLVEEGSPQRRRLERFIKNMKDLAARGKSRNALEKAKIWASRVWGAYKAKNF